MITREKEPLNLEMPFGQLDSVITPNEKFYVRCHFPIPEIDVSSWQLTIDGLVHKPVQLSLEQLRRLGSETVTVTMECAGNSRVFLVPKVKGVQWEMGAVGNAQWTGVRLRSVLQHAGLKPGAREVALEGADNGAIAEPPRPAGKIHYARSIPIEKAMDDVLLALDMNGAPLAPEHGFPVRAIVPGWYGMAAVKWLQRIIVTEEPFNGYYQTVDYAFWKPDEAGPILTPLREMQVKALISRPEEGESISADGSYVVKGAAWSGNATITRVELTTNGQEWFEVKLLGDAQKNIWRFWEYEWTPGAPGKYTLMARATDSRGRVQPMERDGNNGTYVIHHCLPVEVEVR